MSTVPSATLVGSFLLLLLIAEESLANIVLVVGRSEGLIDRDLADGSEGEGAIQPVFHFLGVHGHSTTR